MNDLDVVDPYIQTSLSFEERLHASRWEVILSNNIVVYSNSNRRSWLELKAYLNKQPYIYITSLKFAFRDHNILIYEGRADYFLAHACVGEYGGPTYNYLIGGYKTKDMDKVYCKKYLVPEMFLVEEEYRDLKDASIIKGLIINE